MKINSDSSESKN